MNEVLPWETPGALSQGVSFFFVLSGFILTHAYGQSFSLRKFYLNRFARLWPVHLLCFALAVGLADNSVAQMPALVTISNLTLTHSWFPIVGLPFSFNAPSWSISAELAFYLVFPLLVRARHFWLVYAGIAATVFGVLAYAETLSIPAEPVLFRYWPWHLVLQNPIIRMLEFATGVAAGRLFVSMPQPKSNGTGLELGVLLWLALYWATASSVFLIFLPAHPLFALWYHESGGMLLFAAAIAVFAWGAGDVSKALCHPIFVRLGEMSFCTYMLHQIVIRWWLAQGFDAPWYMAAGFILAASYAGSWTIHTLWERPAKNLLCSSRWALKLQQHSFSRAS